jgi:hypothetical protein
MDFLDGLLENGTLMIEKSSGANETEESKLRLLENEVFIFKFCN